MATVTERVEVSKPEADEGVVVGATLDQVRLSEEILDEMHAPTEADWDQMFAERRWVDYREACDGFTGHPGCGEGW